MRSLLAKSLLLFVALQILAVDVAAGLSPSSAADALSYSVEKQSPLLLVIAKRAECESEEEDSKHKEVSHPVVDFALQAECLCFGPTHSFSCCGSLSFRQQPTPVLLRKLIL
jgi:hypothetical protein